MKTPYINREISWLGFNRRVLEEAQDARNPLLERLRFLSIYGSNLDEFFMVRIGGLMDQVLTDTGEVDALTGQTPEQQMNAALALVREMTREYDRTRSGLFNALAEAGIEILDALVADVPDVDGLKKRFFDRILPLATVIIVDVKHPFPFLPNGTVFTAARLKGKNGEKLGVVMFPEATQRLAFLSRSPIRCFLIEDAAARFAADIFPRHEVLEAGVFRVTRNADLVLDDDALADDADYRAALAHILEKRKRLMPVRLQAGSGADSKLTGLLAQHLGLKNRQIFTQSRPLDMGFAGALIAAARGRGYGHLLFKELPPVYASGLRRGESVIAQTHRRSYLLLHPYMSFDVVLALLREAAFDPAVVAIRQTLYRVSDDSEVVRLLAAAARNGKEVTVVVELKARFDEESNLGWATALEDAGCHVLYGSSGLKVHAKLLLITRNTSKGPRHTVHISTGNYNERTTRQYADVALLTADRHIAHDISLLVRELGVGTACGPYRTVSVSPQGIRTALYRLIDKEIDAARAGTGGHIILKVNSLSDKGMIDKLIEASQAGVKVELIVRGICCLRAGLPGLTENIRVVSIVGRFLEHARLYWFSQNDRLFLSSADLMPRNLDMRVELMCPVPDKRLAAKLKRMLLLQLCDTVKGREMRPDGSYVRLRMEGSAGDSQLVQYALCAEERGEATPRRASASYGSLRDALGNALLRLGRRLTDGSS